MDAFNDNDIISVNNVIQTIDSTTISRTSNPCISYSKLSGSKSDNVGFIQCSKTSIWSRMKPQISCIIPGEIDLT